MRLSFLESPELELLTADEPFSLLEVPKWRVIIFASDVALEETKEVPKYILYLHWDRAVMRTWAMTRVPRPVPRVVQRFLLQSCTVKSSECLTGVQWNTLFMQSFAVSMAHYVALPLGIE